MRHLRDRIRTHTAIEFNRPYLLLALVYMGGIYWLSSLSGLVVKGVDADLLHVPLYAGLAFCLLNTMPETRPRQTVSWRLLGLAFASAVYAALDEWHQSFVSGRDASFGDFSLDLLGIGLMLALSRL
jgi:hypothetical protein